MTGQPPCESNLELEMINSDIANLEKDVDSWSAILESNPPEQDWSHVPFYWKRLTKYGLIKPIDQIYAYYGLIAGTVGLHYCISSFHRAYHLLKLKHCKKGTDQWNHHSILAVATPQQMVLSTRWAIIFGLKGVFLGLTPGFLFISFIKFKYLSMKE